MIVRQRHGETNVFVERSVLALLRRFSRRVEIVVRITTVKKIEGTRDFLLFFFFETRSLRTDNEKRRPRMKLAAARL